MRKFGTSKKDVMEFQLGDSEKIYKLPLIGSMPAEEILAMSELDDEDSFKFFYTFLKKNIGDAASALTGQDVRDIMEAWDEESKAVQGADVGE